MHNTASTPSSDPSQTPRLHDPRTLDEHPLANQLVAASSRFARAVTQVSGIPISPLSMRVLGYIDRNGPQRISLMASVESISQPAMTSAVNRLADDELVLRRPDPLDARAQLVDLTEKGQHMLAEYRGNMAEVLQPRLEALAADDYATVERAVEIFETLTNDLTGLA